MAYFDFRKNGRGMNYLKNHTEFNATIHALGGFALGILVVYFFKLQNPLVWVVVAVLLSLLGHFYAASRGKK